mgnify:CR=1 FL=1
MTIFISGPYGLRKGKRSDYGIDFKKYCLIDNYILDNNFIKWYMHYNFNINVDNTYSIVIIDKDVNTQPLNNI